VLVVFDINETLLDLRALDSIFIELTGTRDARREWFDLLIHTALTVTATGRYEDFSSIGAACLRAVALRHGRTATEADRRALGDGMRALPPHPEVPAELERLAAAGSDLLALGNSPLAVVEDQLRNAGLREYFAAVASAEQAQALKPNPAAYHLVADVTGSPLSTATLVAAHDWDIAGARAVGMRTAFVAREGRQPLPTDPAPHLQGSDLTQITDALIRQR
jgi:2-haloacid dehalogenase